MFAPKIILPTLTMGGYEDHIRNSLEYLRSFVGGKLSK